MTNAGIALLVAALLAAGIGHPPARPVAADAAPRGSDVAIYAATPAAVRGRGDLGWYSSNWAGYAVARGPYRSVSGQWTVPAVSPTGRSAFSAQWVGIDGFRNTSLIQAGTQADFYGGAARYSAWWEILPAPAVAVRGLAIRAGDVVTVTIARVAAGRWRISIHDARSGGFTTTRAYAGPGTSAEWIEEAPVINSRLAALATHPPIVFDNLTANGRSPALSTGDAGAMIRRGVLVDTPSTPDVDGNGFVVAEQAIQPAPPPAS